MFSQLIIECVRVFTDKVPCLYTAVYYKMRYSSRDRHERTFYTAITVSNDTRQSELIAVVRKDKKRLALSSFITRHDSFAEWQTE